MKERNSLIYEGVGYGHPLFATPSIWCLKSHCDCIDPLPPCAPEAALIVAMWGFSASSSLFVLQELGETGELEQAVETALPWECMSKRPPRWPFSYMWEIHIQSLLLRRKQSVCCIFTKIIEKRDNQFCLTALTTAKNLMMWSRHEKCLHLLPQKKTL